jgi:hypothetical protein
MHGENHILSFGNQTSDNWRDKDFILHIAGFVSDYVLKQSEKKHLTYIMLIL